MGDYALIQRQKRLKGSSGLSLELDIYLITVFEFGDSKLDKYFLSLNGGVDIKIHFQSLL